MDLEGMIELTGEAAATLIAMENLLLGMPDPADWTAYDEKVDELDVLIARLKALRAAAAGGTPE